MNITTAPSAPVADLREPTSYELAILGGLQRKAAGEVYQGTANPLRVARRRARNKVAARSRRLNRS